MSFLELLHLNYDHHLFILHLVHWDWIQIVSFHYCQFQIYFFAITIHHKPHRLAPHIYYMNFEEGNLKLMSTWFILQCVKFFINSNISHSKVTCNAISFVSCGLFFTNNTLMGLFTPYVGKPIFFANMGSWNSVLLVCRPNMRYFSHWFGLWPWLKATSLDHKITI